MTDYTIPMIIGMTLAFTLVRSVGNRWRCPKCGRIYTISALGLGRMRQVAFGSQDDENMVKKD